MEINPAIERILKEFNINRDSGVLVLLGIYHNLNVDEVCDEETVKAVNITKIVEKDYRMKSVKWNIALFTGQETEWDWVVSKYNNMWDINKDRKDNNIDVLKRMKKFFATYPQYRKQDIRRATVAYFKSVRDPEYLKSSAKFIFEGIGAMQKSMLLTWCEKVADSTETQSYQKGKIIK